MNEQIIAKLFCTGTDSCLTNVEFMEVFNEALFVSLDKKPEVFIKQFSLSLNQEFIIKQLESPITDKIDIQKIIEKLASLSMKKNTESYDKILQALNVAKKKAQ